MPVTEITVQDNRSAALRANNPFYIVVLSYVLISVIVARHWNVPIDVKLYNEGFWIFGGAAAVILFALISTRVMINRPNRLWPEIIAQLGRYRTVERAIKGIPILVVFPIFFSVFTSMKDGINRIVPFYADKKLIEIDRFLHGGMDSWLLIQPFMKFELETFILNVFYNLWFVFMFVILFCVTFSMGNDRLRSHYLVAFVMIWAIVGNLAATVFSSVGPAFVMPFYGDNTFVPLMDYLKAINNVYPVWALYAQNMLLANAALDGPHMGSGISAFPSMHLAIATMNAAFLWRFGGFLRWSGIAFLIITQLGAIHLAWHYGIDGYASILVTPIIWVIAGRVSGFLQARTA